MAHWKLICSMTFKAKKRRRAKAAIKWLKLKERCCTEFREELSEKESRWKNCQITGKVLQKW